MILKIMCIFLRTKSWKGVRNSLNTRNISNGSNKLLNHKSNSTLLVSYDDLRLQKYLKYVREQSLNEQEKEYIGNQQNREIMSHIVSLMDDIEVIDSQLKELDLFISELEKQGDKLVNEALAEKKTLKDKLNAVTHKVLLSMIPEEPIDDKDIIMELSPGVGGKEAMLFTKDVFDMYYHYAQWKGWSCEVLKYDASDLGGIRSAHLGINGSNAFKILKYECGVHRVQRIPKTEKAGRIHTSTMTVAVLPQPNEIDIVINPNDIELEFKRSSGAGGQHVNTTDSCVRIHHKPSGIVIESQMERDQHKNRALAMKSLRAKLYERELQNIIKETNSARKSQISSVARSEKVRTYNFAQDRITDHRAQLQIYDIESFFKGEDNLDRLLVQLQEWSKMQYLMELLNKYDSA